MTNQEQGFAEPATSSGDRRPINTDPREQRGFVPPTINIDPREQPQWQAGQPPIMTRPPYGGHGPWRWLGVSILILVVIFGGLATASLALRHATTETKTFTVGNQPKLILTNDSGDVHISSGPANQISIVARQHIFLGSSQIPVQYDLSSDHNTLTISVNAGFTFGFFHFNNDVDFDVTAPSQTALEVHTDSGSITSSGVSRQMTLTTDSGNITTDGGSGQVTLTTDSGSITASNISGRMTLKTDSGNITATNASASKSAIFHADSGSITYEGSLAPNGTYDFRTDSGNVSLTLPGDAAFQVQASTDSGSIDSAFSGVNVLSGDSGAQASGSTGSAPFAHITIQTDSGSIHLHRA